MGRNNYIVTYKNRSYFHETQVSYRRDPLPIATKVRLNAKIIQRDANVFKLWQRDTPEQLTKAYDLDFGYQKLAGVIKQPADQEDVKELFLKHYAYLKDVYLTLVINGVNFPFVNSQDFTRFIKQCDIFDNNLKQSQLDYLVSNVKGKQKAIDAPKIQNQQPLDLSRAEFFELLIRIAIFKYKEHAPKGSFVQITECIEKLIVEKIIPNFEPAPWQSFRDELLYCREVNLAFHDN